MYRHIPLVALSLFSSCSSPPAATARRRQPRRVRRSSSSPSRRGGEPGLSRRDPRPPRAGAGLPHRRQGHPPAGGSRRAGEEGPAPGRTRSPGRAPATGGGAGQVSAAEANLQTVRASTGATAPCSTATWSAIPSSRTSRTATAPARRIRAEFNVADNQAGCARAQDGVIASRRVEVGQVVAAGQTVFSLAADGEREVLIGLPEHSFERFRIGQPVSVELWSQRDRRFAGHIRELSPAADPQSRTFAARVAFDDRATPAELGQSARVCSPPRRCRYRFVGADRRGRPGVRLGRTGQLDPAPAAGAHRSLCRGPCAGARRPEGWRLGGGHRGPGASRRAAGASDRPGQPHGETGGQGVVACPSTFPPGRCRIARSSCT